MIFIWWGASLALASLGIQGLVEGFVIAGVLVPLSLVLFGASLGYLLAERRIIRKGRTGKKVRRRR